MECYRGSSEPRSNGKLQDADLVSGADGRRGALRSAEDREDPGCGGAPTFFFRAENQPGTSQGNKHQALLCRALDIKGVLCGTARHPRVPSEQARNHSASGQRDVPNCDEKGGPCVGASKHASNSASEAPLQAQRECSEGPRHGLQRYVLQPRRLLHTPETPPSRIPRPLRPRNDRPCSGRIGEGEPLLHVPNS